MLYACNTAQNNSVYPIIKEHKKIHFCAQQTWVNSFESLNNVGYALVQSSCPVMMMAAEKICLLEKQRSQGTPVSFQERQHCTANGKGEEEKELVCSIKKKNIVSLLQMLQLQCLTKYS